jgi:hypothetical protein
MCESRLISFEQASQLLGGDDGLHPNTIRQRKGGTENLTHVGGFGRRKFLIRAEVLELVEKKINEASKAEQQRREILSFFGGKKEESP